MPGFSHRFGLFLLAVSLSLTGAAARAQHGGGGGHGGGMPGGGGMGGPGMPMGGNPGFNYRPDYGTNSRSRNGSPDSAGTRRGGLQLGPPGRWWDDKHFAKKLNLRPEQQQHMDSIFEANRPNLAKRLDDLQQEQGRLEAMYRSKTLDENTLYGQIDKVSQARAELGKVYTHYMLQIRGEMDTDQLKKLQDATNTQPQ